MATISLRAVHKRYGGVEVLRGIDLEVGQGEFVVLVGPSGCGKSTLLRLVAGLEDLSSGEIRIDGERVDDLSPKDRDVAMVFQSYALYPHMTVRDNMSYALRRRGESRVDIDAAVRAASAKLGLDALLDRKPKDLSGGQRQRVAMGRALVRNPKVFLFDEPLSNLDARLREQMRYEIRKLQRELGTTTVYVTHDQIEAMTMADRIVAMNEGIVQQIGSPSELYEQPANRFVAEFIGSPGMNFLAADLAVVDGGAEVRVGGRLLGSVPAPVPRPWTAPAAGVGTPPGDGSNGPRGVVHGVPVVVGIRPERVGLADPASGIGATVDWVEPTGLGAVVHVDLAGQAVKLFTTARGSPSPGARVGLILRPEDLLLFDAATGRRL